MAAKPGQLKPPKTVLAVSHLTFELARSAKRLRARTDFLKRLQKFSDHASTGRRRPGSPFFLFEACSTLTMFSVASEIVGNVLWN